ncbi:hypothetical protein ACODNH_04975 [Haloarcula sp. NS06]|uniref:hypothetical protein n=1 Tax=unclassified Haloarcula TaxID=2624677 RepID=UPI0027B5B7FA|nr:hypothetical protein [Haloarcula sp. H-GB4]MDQ2072856.1 hypothetical protein [Haloarcula sp. H-GB4]
MSPIEVVGEKVSTISDGSQIAGVGQVIGARASEFLRESYCYRWLTKEPEPEVIVIDLRETYAVGLFIALLDRLVPHIEDAWRHSTVGSVARRAFEQLAADVFDPLSEMRGYELAVALLTPPEPPEQKRTDNDESEPAEDDSS